MSEEIPCAVSEKMQSLVERLNKVDVSRRDIMAMLAGMQRMRAEFPQERNPGVHVIKAFYRNEPLKGQAVYFRMLAMSRLLDGDKEKMKGWVRAHEGGGVMASEEVLAVTAIHPLKVKKTEIVFDLESFMLKVLEVCDCVGHG